MTTKSLPNPVSFSYLAALRGIKPRSLGTAFAYADLTCVHPEQLVCLAASNPEGLFFGIVGHDIAKAGAEKIAAEREVANVRFKSIALQDLADAAQTGATDLPALDYICADATARPLEAADRLVLAEIAQKLLTPGGIFNLRYQAYADPHGALKFLVREFAPEMNAEQAKGLLVELRDLGKNYLGQYPDIAAKLDHAIQTGMPDEFFSLWDTGSAGSAAFDTRLMVGTRGMAYLGDEDISKNYIELSLTPAAQAIIEKCREHPLYEPLKDYALARMVRSDVWCRPPVQENASMAELFGSFVYGIPMAKDDVPHSMTVPGVTLSFAAPLYQKLINVLTMVPASIGDFLSHPEGQGFAPSEVVGAVQILIACGIARPMRGGTNTTNVNGIAHPQLVGSFNRFLDKTAVTDADTWLASPVLGGGIAVTPRDALVMQAVTRVGLADSVSALLPELERLAKNPSAASRVMDSAAPTPEMAHHMIEDTITRSILHWYAYGLLEAA